MRHVCLSAPQQESLCEQDNLEVKWCQTIALVTIPWRVEPPLLGSLVTGGKGNPTHLTFHHHPSGSRRFPMQVYCKW